jgi:hypothetical protein
MLNACANDSPAFAWRKETFGLPFLSAPGFLPAFASLCWGGGLIVTMQIVFFGGIEFVRGLEGGHWLLATSLPDFHYGTGSADAGDFE